MARLIVRNLTRTQVHPAQQKILQWFIFSSFCLLASLISLTAFAHGTTTDPVPPQMRLGNAMKPLSYHAELTIVPERDQFDGELTIDIEVMQAKDLFWLNATNLNVKTASLSLNGQTLNPTLIKTKQDFIGLQFTQALPLGKGRLTFVYSGDLSRKNTHGLFKQKDGANWYVFSQFEDTYARRAFPCFDEPQWKTPWTLALTVKRDQLAVANTPVVSEQNVGVDMKRVEFAPTPPLPSYLIAMGVGPFDVVDGGTAGINKTPLRYITPKGRGAETAYAVKTTPKILNILEDYFGSPYPFAKLDSMVIPVTINFGAMENVGLITYRSNLMLAPAGREDMRFQQAYASVAAHEIAHQWFGDLVTMAWWNDLWLNESFATWMAHKAMKTFNPEWENHAQGIQQRLGAMKVDQFASTRRIRQTINTPDDLANAFDRITYSKGASVLRMFEATLGEERFRDGVRRYLKRHEFGSATAEDFFAALADKDPEIAQAFASFVEQPGVPMVSMALNCTAKPAITLQQQRYLPGRQQGNIGSQEWIVPVCLRYEGQTSAQPFCTVLREKVATITLPDAQACPKWVLPNPAGTGYYLSNIDQALLPKQDLASPEVVALGADLSLMARSGSIPLTQLLAFAARYANDARPDVAKAAVRATKALHPAWLNASARKQHNAWIQRHFGQRARTLGWQPEKGETDAQSQLREDLLPLAAQAGADPLLRKQARTLALQWLNQTGETELGTMLPHILKTAALNADKTVFSAFVTAAAKTRSNRHREAIFSALGMVSNPALRSQAFALLLSDRFDTREAVSMLSVAGEQAENRTAMLQFVRENYTAILAKMPDAYGSRLPSLGQGLCTKPERDAFLAFFEPRVTKHPGGARNLAQTLEDINICVATGELQIAAGKQYPSKLLRGQRQQ